MNRPHTATSTNLVSGELIMRSNSYPVQIQISFSGWRILAFLTKLSRASGSGESYGSPPSKLNPVIYGLASASKIYSSVPLVYSLPKLKFHAAGL